MRKRSTAAADGCGEPERNGQSGPLSVVGCHRNRQASMQNQLADSKKLTTTIDLRSSAHTTDAMCTGPNVTLNTHAKHLNVYYYLCRLSLHYNFCPAMLAVFVFALMKHYTYRALPHRRWDEARRNWPQWWRKSATHTHNLRRPNGQKRAETNPTESENHTSGRIKSHPKEWQAANTNGREACGGVRFKEVDFR